MMLTGRTPKVVVIVALTLLTFYKTSQHAKDLVMALIAEHSSKKNVLEDDQVLNLVYIIQER